MTRFKVVSIHPTKMCDLHCPFCYRNDSKAILLKDERPLEWWLGMIPAFKKLAPQVAMGGGEMLLMPSFIQTFAQECKNQGLICNLTTNGRKLLDMPYNEIPSTFENVTMVSVSLDSFKYPLPDKKGVNLLEYERVIRVLRGMTPCQVGCNLLLEPWMFNNPGEFPSLVAWLFQIGVDRVFALMPKNNPLPIDMTSPEIRGLFFMLTLKHPHFYVDDCLKMILEEAKYDDWKGTCHRGRDMISINEKGEVSLCSFDKPFARVDSSNDLLKLVDSMKDGGLSECPFVVKPKGGGKSWKKIELKTMSS